MSYFKNAKPLKSALRSATTVLYADTMTGSTITIANDNGATTELVEDVVEDAVKNVNFANTIRVVKIGRNDGEVNFAIRPANYYNIKIGGLNTGKMEGGRINFEIIAIRMDKGGW